MLDCQELASLSGFALTKEEIAFLKLEPINSTAHFANVALERKPEYKALNGQYSPFTWSLTLLDLLKKDLKGKAVVESGPSIPGPIGPSVAQAPPSSPTRAATTLALSERDNNQAKEKDELARTV